MSGPIGRGRGIALVGYRATGKSTVGRIVADRLGVPFADADREVEAAEPVGRSARSSPRTASPPSATARPGYWPTWPKRLAGPGGGLATGGGAVLLEANRRRRSAPSASWPG